MRILNLFAMRKIPIAFENALRVYSGIIKKETATELLINSSEDGLVTIKTADIKVCLNDKELFDRILSSRVEGTKEFDIGSTPTFIIGKETISGVMPYENFKKVFDRALRK